MEFMQILGLEPLTSQLMIHRDHCGTHDYIISIEVLLKYINIDFNPV